MPLGHTVVSDFSDQRKAWYLTGGERDGGRARDGGSYGFVKRRTFEMMLPDSGMESVASFRSQALNPQFSANLFGIYVQREESYVESWLAIHSFDLLCRDARLGLGFQSDLCFYAISQYMWESVRILRRLSSHETSHAERPSIKRSRVYVSVLARLEIGSSFDSVIFPHCE